MNRLDISLLAIALGLVFSISIVYAEIAKKGSATDTVYYTSTYQILAQENENLGVNFDARGIVSSEDETNPFHKASAQCLGTFREKVNLNEIVYRLEQIKT